MTTPRTAKEFRDFARLHHPDRGGDPEVFAAGVAAYRARASPEPAVVFYRKRTLLAQLLDALRTRLPTSPGRSPRPHDRRAR